MRMLEIKYMHGPCPQCGARDMDEADRLCRPKSDETGEQYCGGRFNEHGMSEIPTPESLAAMDQYYAAREALEPS